MKNPKVLFLLAAFFAAGIFHLYGQDAKVASGVKAYNDKNYSVAIQLLEQSLKRPSELSANNLPKAHLYLAQAYLRVGNDDGFKRDFADPLQSAFDHLEAGRKADQEGKWTEMTSLMEKLLWTSLYNEGALYYNADEYATSIELFDKANNLEKTNYRAFLMMGYAYWMSKNADKALENWNQARKLYHLDKPPKSDPNLIAAYIITADHHAKTQNNANLALSVLAEGRKEFPDNEDLQMSELGIYQNNPRMIEKSKAKFENAISARPGDKTIQLAYAALLTENGETDKGLEVYEKVLKIDPRDYNANLAIGADLYNKGAAITQKIIKSEDKEAIIKLQEEAWTTLQKAFPHLKILHEREPQNPQWINYLVYITQYVPDLQGEASTYLAKQKK